MSEVNHFWQNSFFLMPNWKWMTLVILFGGGYFLKPLIKAWVSWLKGAAASKKLHKLISLILERKIEGSLSWILIALFWYFSVDALELPARLEKYFFVLNQLVWSVCLIRLAYLTVEAFGIWIDDILSKDQNTLDNQLAPLATKTLKVFVIVFGSLIVLQNFGFNVMSLLAGLGLGGLALALAAQDTAANVFGSITIILDQPFQVGDWIKVGTTEGTVEEIGFRSTRVRTFYQSLVSIPNSVMAKELIDNMGARPFRRIRHVLGITYDTPNMKIQQFTEQIRYLLLQQPQVKKEDVRVYFKEMGDFNLQVLVQFLIDTTDNHEELQIQEEILLEIKAIAEKVGVEFAFPTQTIHLPSSVPVPARP
jgi:MscS family membrane protein